MVDAATSSTPDRSSGLFTRQRDSLWILVGLLALTGLGWLFLPPQPGERKHAMPPCLRNLHAISRAIYAYQADYDCLPPAVAVDEQGRPMHSWRALIAPYLRDRWQEEAVWLEEHRMDFGYWESGDFDRRAAAARTKARQLTDFLAAYDFSKPWNGPANLRLTKHRADAFVCPDNKSARSANTNYVAVVGEETAWRESRLTRLADFRDGTVRTAIIVEIGNSTIPWTQPVDLPFSSSTFEIDNGAPNRIGNPFGRGANYLFGDGGVMHLRTPSPAVLKALFTIDGGEDGYDDVLGYGP